MKSIQEPEHQQPMNYNNRNSHTLASTYMYFCILWTFTKNKSANHCNNNLCVCIHLQLQSTCYYIQIFSSNLHIILQQC